MFTQLVYEALCKLEPGNLYTQDNGLYELRLQLVKDGYLEKTAYFKNYVSVLRRVQNNMYHAYATIKGGLNVKQYTADSIFHEGFLSEGRTIYFDLPYHKQSSNVLLQDPTTIGDIPTPFLLRAMAKEVSKQLEVESRRYLTKIVQKKLLADRALKTPKYNICSVFASTEVPNNQWHMLTNKDIMQRRVKELVRSLAKFVSVRPYFQLTYVEPKDREFLDKEGVAFFRAVDRIKRSRTLFWSDVQEVLRKLCVTESYTETNLGYVVTPERIQEALKKSGMKGDDIHLEFVPAYDTPNNYDYDTMPLNIVLYKTRTLSTKEVNSAIEPLLPSLALDIGTDLVKTYLFPQLKGMTVATLHQLSKL